MAHEFKLIIDPVASIEGQTKKVTLKSGRVLEGYDYLIVAIGQGKMQMERNNFV